MSKPDPTITANLLGSLAGKPGPDGHGALDLPGMPGHAERHPAPSAHKTTRPAPLKQAMGHTRSSNRGK